MFAVLRFFTGFCITVNGELLKMLLGDHSNDLYFLTGVEWVDVNHRKLVGVVDSFSWSIWNCVFPGIAYHVTDWRWLILCVSSPLILSIITWRWMPESARWLIANGKFEQAQIHLKKCAKMNGAEESSPILSIEVCILQAQLNRKTDQTYSYLDLIRTPKMRKIALSTGILWFCLATAYYGISFNIQGLGLSIYLTQFVYSLIELPAKGTVYYLLDKIGRRPTQMGALLCAAICLGINLVIPKDLSVPRTVVAVIGKGFSSASFSTVVLYCSELYPTVLRQNGFGYNSFMGRLGVALAPFILLLDEVWEKLPQLVLCLLALTGGLVARTLSETRNRFLPETIEDIEQQWKNKKPTSVKQEFSHNYSVRNTSND
uniref:Solute carrier family 22 member 7b, tandem duplicate 3 n=1 Tax=Oryzias latipes TaxID=8090 RepID=A0A3P9IH91_ORYLA